jgi:UTP-glucose-1-phosphate uridylyltransferase
MSKQPKTLLVLAAGMGSRYGGLKQLDELGPAGETIIDYSIYDALKAGFNKLVFIIRDEFRTEFQEKITNKFKHQAEIVFVNQAINTPIEGIDVSVERTKPWGTGHAVLVAAPAIQEPFAVINADDFYGRDAFRQAALFMDEEVTATRHGIIGYILKNTLSDNGHVSRGVCQANDRNMLTAINERTKIQRIGQTVQYEEAGIMHEVDENSIVSMNFWVFHHSIFDHLYAGFRDFVASNKDNPKAEYFIPLVADALIRENKGEFAIKTCNAQWFGVTYREDKPDVMSELAKMTAEGVYPSPLF